MAEEPLFRGIIDFFVQLGIYDVILPFLLVFSVVFAILEKTKVFGTEHMSDGKEVTRKNINAMVAFVIAFFVIASKQLVATINKALANVVLLLLLIVMFLMLVGAFFKDGEKVGLEKGALRTTFIVIVMISIILIFLNAIPTKNGDSNWLEFGWNWLVDNWSGNAVGAIVLVGVMVLLMLYITGGPAEAKKGS